MGSTKRNIFIVAGAFFTVFAAWYAWLIYPQRVEMETIQHQIVGLVRKVEAATVDENRLDDLRKEIVGLQGSLKVLEERLYPRQRVPEILREISRLGNGYDLRFSAIFPKYDELLQDIASDGSPLLVLPLEIQVDGSYQNFGKFIGQLDVQPYLFSVTRVEMSMTKESYPLVRIVLQGNLFLQREDASTKDEEVKPKA